jgi:threonine dehydrogenase-like Zn-dependent dehydrogenase
MVYTALDELRLLDVEEPQRIDGDVIVAVKAAGICGSDLEGFASRSPFRAPPLIMGHEFSGVRADTGERVVVNPVVACGHCDLCLRGQRNICRNRAIIGIQRPGAFAERVAVPEANCYPLPDDLTFEQAAMVEPVANAIHALRLAQAHDAQPARVGVIGAGTLGLATAWIALRHGVRDVAIADLSDARLHVARAAGVPTASTQLDGEFDVVFDAVGLAETRAASVALARPGGTAVWIGLHGAEPGFDGLAFIRTEKRVLATFCYHDQDYQAAIRLASNLDPAWLATASLEQGPRTFYDLLKGPSEVIKTVLVTTPPRDLTRRIRDGRSP